MHKYKRIAQTIRERIQEGFYPLKSALPDQMKLCKEFDASRITIKRALEILIEEGYLYSRQGSGTYVMKNAGSVNAFDSLADEYPGVTEQLAGKEVESEILKFVIRNPLAKEVEKLLVEVDDFIYDIKRVRYVNGESIVIEHTIMPVSVIPGINKEVLSHSIYGYIRNELNLSFGGITRRITAEKPDELDRKYLLCTKEDPVLQVEQVVHLKDGTPFEYSITKHRFDKGGINVVDRYHN
ncbi:GntR family transcriptional regulator [Lacticigenium naphthae]|uniref:GntR family transcriptional regulator n=1 Tax=Lacticigenium naphthae TaxID=515351 RepID=UPI000423AEB7|nr:GntR family transcriptional regulator [Lacticigenium naphthae]